MVNLDRVEMLRTSERGSRTFALSAEEAIITPTPFDVQKRQQTKAVRDQISMFTYSEDDEEEECREESTSKETNDAKQPQEESREIAPVANKKKEVFIEAELETVLETDNIVSAARKALKIENDDVSVKSNSAHSTRSFGRKFVQRAANIQTDRLLLPFDEEASQYGVEIEYGFSTGADYASVYDSVAEESVAEVKEESADNIEEPHKEESTTEINVEPNVEEEEKNDVVDTTKEEAHIVENKETPEEHPVPERDESKPVIEEPSSDESNQMAVEQI